MSNARRRGRRPAGTPTLGPMADVTSAAAARRQRRHPRDLAPWMTGTGTGPEGRAVVTRHAEAAHRLATAPIRSRRYTAPGLLAHERRPLTPAEVSAVKVATAHRNAQRRALEAHQAAAAHLEPVEAEGVPWDDYHRAQEVHHAR